MPRMTEQKLNGNPVENTKAGLLRAYDEYVRRPSDVRLATTLDDFKGSTPFERLAALHEGRASSSASKVPR